MPVCILPGHRILQTPAADNSLCKCSERGHIMKSILSVHLAFKNHILAGLKKYNLNYDLRSGQPKIIYYLASHKGCQQKDVAKYCEIETATLSTVLSKMEANGLIERRRNENDGRAYSIYPTKSGQKIFDAVEEQFDTSINTAFSGFSQKELKELHSYLARIEKNLKSDIAK